MASVSTPGRDWQARSRRLFAEFNEPGIHFGTEVEKLLVVTRWLGNTWGARCLAIVDQAMVYACAECQQLVTRVQVGNLRFLCSVEAQFGGLRCVANLLDEHIHEGDEAVL